MVQQMRGISFTTSYSYIYFLTNTTYMNNMIGLTNIKVSQHLERWGSGVDWRALRAAHWGVGWVGVGGNFEFYVKYFVFW